MRYMYVVHAKRNLTFLFRFRFIDLKISTDEGKKPLGSIKK